MRARRRELFSQKVSAGSRTYVFDVKESADKTKYLLISESRQSGEGSYERSRLMVFEEHVGAFHGAMKKAIDFMGLGSRSWACRLAQIRRKYPRAYEKWSEGEDARLRIEYAQSRQVPELARTFQRRPSAITSRLNKLGLLPEA